MIRIACRVGSEIQFLSTTKFHSGEFIIPKFDWKSCNEIEVQCFYDSDADIAALLLLGAHLREIEDLDGDINLFIPYIPYSRMDRFTDKEYEQFTALKSLLFNYYYNKIYTRDLHNPSTNKGLEAINREYKGIISNHHAVVLPDKTAFLRYTNTYGFDKRFIVFDKVRDGGKIVSKIVFDNTNFMDADFIIVDDICSRGGTFSNAAIEIRDKYPNRELNFDLLISHTENGIFTGNLFDHIRTVYTTNSILTDTTNPLMARINLIEDYRNEERTYII